MTGLLSDVTTQVLSSVAAIHPPVPEYRHVETTPSYCHTLCFYLFFISLSLARSLSLTDVPPRWTSPIKYIVVIHSADRRLSPPLCRAPENDSGYSSAAFLGVTAADRPGSPSTPDSLLSSSHYSE